MIIRKIMFLLVAMLMAATGKTFADEIPQVVGGVRYLLDSDTKTAKVAALRGEKYAGQVTVQEKVKDGDGVEYLVTALDDHAFDECRQLTGITLPSSITTIGEQCFAFCTQLTSIVLPSSLTALSDHCFYCCYKLASVTIPSSVTSIGRYCFEGCGSLTSIDIPSSVTSLGEACFDECSGLTSLTIPSSVQKVGPSCLMRCSNLESLTFEGECPDGLAESYLISSCAIYVPGASLQAYRDVLGSKYPNIYAIQESGDTPFGQCATPTITYANGKLRFSCATPNAEYHSVIADADVMRDKYVKDGEQDLTATYTITVYATADGYKPSEKATATLRWSKGKLAIAM